MPRWDGARLVYRNGEQYFAAEERGVRADADSETDGIYQPAPRTDGCPRIPTPDDTNSTWATKASQ